MARIEQLQFRIQDRLNIARANNADPRLIEMVEMILELSEIVRNHDLGLTGDGGIANFRY